MTAPAKPDRRRTRHEPQYRTRIRLVPCPPEHQDRLDEGFDLLAAIGRRALAAKATP